MNNQPQFTADLHIHSRYAYACSKNLTLPNLAAAAKTKGIHLLATGDFTHPAWLAELQTHLTPTHDGAYQYHGVNFIPGTEISCVYRQNGQARRLHLLLFLPTLDAAAQFNAHLSQRGAKLDGDGRPTLTLSAPDLMSLALDTHPEAMIIPAHIWTPWYGILGSVSGFDTLQECFGPLTPMIQAIETGLSSDPAMNWPVPELRHRAILSFSDAHSLPNLGREITAFRGQPTYPGLKAAIETNNIAHTIEFYPQEGKYHYNGHRHCGISQSPQATAAQNDARCPACRRPLTLGVLHRTQSLSNAPEANANPEPAPAPDGYIRAPDDSRPPFLRLVPLEELLSETLSAGRRTKTVANAYNKLCHELGSELAVLAHADADQLQQAANEPIAHAILKARAGQVSAQPGFDGQYGAIRVWPDDPPNNPQQSPLL